MHQWFQGKITQIEIATHSSGYILFECVNKSSNEWSNLLVVHNASKKSWELGWNGTRLSNGHAAKALLAHDPAIHQWVLETVSRK